MGTAVKTLSLEEYLSNPTYEHSEYVNGEVVELNVGNLPHSSIQSVFVALLFNYLKANAIGRVFTEVRCRLTVGGRPRFFLPDVSVLLGPVPVETGYLDRAPDLVVEVRSPDDSVSELLRKMDEYFANGARLAWLVLPEERAVLVLTPNAPVRTVTGSETLDGGDLLPGLQIPLSELFA
ncbi:MAG: Uma2 family endonuclease [Acidobacteriota bacterium]